jgi:hypothetical protein
VPNEQKKPKKSVGIDTVDVFVSMLDRQCAKRSFGVSFVGIDPTVWIRFEIGFLEKKFVGVDGPAA